MKLLLFIGKIAIIDKMLHKRCNFFSYKIFTPIFAAQNKNYGSVAQLDRASAF